MTKFVSISKSQKEELPLVATIAKIIYLFTVPHKEKNFRESVGMALLAPTDFFF